MIETHNNRAIITLSGPERKKLLQGIITANIDQLQNGQGVYGALLSAQGKFLHDFFLLENEDTIYLDCERDRLADLFRRLLMYRLRSNVEIIDQSEKFSVITSNDKIDDHDLSFRDPRHPEMGYRAIAGASATTDDVSTYHARRIALGIPEGSGDFIVDKSTILEGHFEQINGVDFEKGCYVGQEVTARMKYRGKIKKLMFPVILSGPAPAAGSDITDENGNKIGDLRSNCDKNAIAMFKIDKMQFGHAYDCCDIKVTPFKPDFYQEDADA